MNLRAVGFLSLALVLQEIGCPIVDSKVVEGFRKYFPNATCTHPTPDTLFLETNLAGSLSPLLCEELFKKFVGQKAEFSRLKEGFAFAKYRWLCIGLADTVVAWDKTREEQFWILTRQQFSMPGWWEMVPASNIGDSSVVTASESSEETDQAKPVRQESKAVKAVELIGDAAGAVAEAGIPKPVVLMSGNFNIRPGAFYFVPFEVLPMRRPQRVSGNFTASGGSGNDIEAFICSELDFLRFKNGDRNIRPGFMSGRVHVGDVNVAMPPGRYCLVFSNIFSSFSTKSVTAQISLVMD